MKHWSERSFFIIYFFDRTAPQVSIWIRGNFTINFRDVSKSGSFFAVREAFRDADALFGIDLVDDAATLDIPSGGCFLSFKFLEFNSRADAFGENNILPEYRFKFGFGPPSTALAPPAGVDLLVNDDEAGMIFMGCEIVGDNVGIDGNIGPHDLTGVNDFERSAIFFCGVLCGSAIFSVHFVKQRRMGFSERNNLNSHSCLNAMIDRTFRLKLNATMSEMHRTLPKLNSFFLLTTHKSRCASKRERDTFW